MIRRLILATALALTGGQASATAYTLESEHSQGVIHWEHLGFAHPAALLSQIEGTVNFDPADPTRSSVSVVIKLVNLSTGVPDLDDDFHSARFFDIARYPTATFKSTRVERGDGPDKLKVTGDLSLRGITRPVTLDVIINKVGRNVRNNLPSVGFDATAMLKRSDFGLGAFVPQVSDEVSIDITCEGSEAIGYAKRLHEEAQAAQADAKKAEAGKH